MGSKNKGYALVLIVLFGVQAIGTHKALAETGVDATPNTTHVAFLGNVRHLAKCFRNGTCRRYVLRRLNELKLDILLGQVEAFFDEMNTQLEARQERHRIEQFERLKSLLSIEEPSQAVKQEIVRTIRLISAIKHT